MTVVAVDPLELLDFTPALPCEHSRHNHTHRREEVATWYMTAGPCPACGNTPPPLFICESGRLRLVTLDLVAHMRYGCGVSSSSDAWKFHFEPIGERP